MGSSVRLLNTDQRQEHSQTYIIAYMRPAKTQNSLRIYLYSSISVFVVWSMGSQSTKDFPSRQRRLWPERVCHLIGFPVQWLLVKTCKTKDGLHFKELTKSLALNAICWTLVSYILSLTLNSRTTRLVILHGPKKVNWNLKLNFIECPIIKHLILSPDSLWRFCPRPVREDFVPGLFVKNVDNS